MSGLVGSISKTSKKVNNGNDIINIIKDVKKIEEQIRQAERGNCEISMEDIER